MPDKSSWFVKLWYEGNPACYGVGECGPLPGLSLDATPGFEEVLQKVIQDVALIDNPKQIQSFYEIIPSNFPSIRFGIETAWLDLLHGGRRIIYKNDFLNGKPIPINGLIWMGNLEDMIQQVHQKIMQGFRCIKLKIGGLDFEQECTLLRNIRRQFPPNEITIRLDANGAFHPDDALAKLTLLSEFDIHSIEQPIKEGQKEMEDLCKNSPIPIALDEELIPHQTRERKLQLLEGLKPRYIILKPTLHGGISGCEEWIDVAESSGIEWWITSALESNIGLNAICQYTANHKISLPQGLGTGSIYHNNIESPLTVSDGNIFLDKIKAWNLEPVFL